MLLRLPQVLPSGTSCRITTSRGPPWPASSARLGYALAGQQLQLQRCWTLRRTRQERTYTDALLEETFYDHFERRLGRRAACLHGY
jgi:hypothetical protein